MIKEAFGSGSTIEEAYEAAVKALNAPDGVEVQKEIVELPKKKILGLFGSTVTKARAYYETEDEQTVEFKPDVKKETRKEAPAKKETAAKKAPAKKETAAKTEETPVVSHEDGPAQQYLKAILHGLNIDEAEIITEKTSDSISFQINCGDDYGSVIGHRGETLDAIQYLTRLVVNRGKEEYKRVSVNVGNYREKRTNTLTELAKKNASKVMKYGRNVVLEPMNPYERRVIHTAIQQIENVESYSIGNDDSRRVVIKLMDGVQPTNPGAGKYNGRSRDSRGGRGGYNRNKSHSKSASHASGTNEAPKSDLSSAALYGKIESRANTEDS